MPTDLLDELYAAPPERFVALRNELAKRLKKEGRRDEAADVASRRRPSLVVWALNQLARHEREDLRRLFALDERLREMQASGAAPAPFRAASEERHAAVSRLVDAGSAVLREAGHESAGARDTLAEALLALASDNDARAELEAGRLTREPEVSAALFSIGTTLAGGAEKSDSTRKDRGDRRPDAARRRAVELHARAEELQDQARRLTEEARGKETEARRAEGAAQRARREAERARREADRAASRAEDARARAEAAEEDLREQEGR